MSEPASAASSGAILPGSTFRGRALIAFGRTLAALAWHLRIRRGVALENLARAFPGKTPLERNEIARATYRALGTSLGEMLLAGSVSNAQLESWIGFDGFERYQLAAAKEKGVVVAIAHFGNWELLGRACARRGVRLSLIGRRLRGFFNRRVIAARVESGMKQLADRGSSSEALQLLRGGAVLAIAVDQNMRERRGIFVDFFGHPACTTPAAAVYALRAGAPIIAAFPVRDSSGHHRVLVKGPFEAAANLRGHEAVKDLTQQLTRAVEEVVRAHPEHWYWLHRRWKTQPR